MAQAQALLRPEDAAARRAERLDDLLAEIPVRPQDHIVVLN